VVVTRKWVSIASIQKDNHDQVRGGERSRQFNILERTESKARTKDLPLWIQIHHPYPQITVEHHV
jgi:hypothetical protein